MFSFPTRPFPVPDTTDCGVCTNCWTPYDWWFGLISVLRVLVASFSSVQGDGKLVSMQVIMLFLTEKSYRHSKLITSYLLVESVDIWIVSMYSSQLHVVWIQIFFGYFQKRECCVFLLSVFSNTLDKPQNNLKYVSLKLSRNFIRMNPGSFWSQDFQ